MAGETGDTIPERTRDTKGSAQETPAVNEQGPAAEQSGQAAAPQPSVEAEMPREETELVETHDRALCPVVGVGAERSIGIILSGTGTGSDGTLGLRAIKAVGGMAMVQKEDQAKYDSIPRSAIETGMVDFILPVEKMGERLGQYIRHPYLEQRKTPETEEKVEDQLQKIFLLIRNHTGHDFSHYKRNTVRRRIARRLAVHQIEDLDHYLKLLQENPDETGLLAREMLITVTNFFRDREAWDSLTDQVIHPLVEQTPSEVPLRIWVAGCATGEEAYTVAILFHEQVNRHNRRHLLQIFATDLDEASVNVGRRGVYPKSIATDVAPARLPRFFTEEGNNYKIKNNLRETIVFAKHNLIKDAPFSKLDLVCCRNVLIYLDSSLQRRLIPMFHDTLNPNGILFLGESESIGTFADLFAPVDIKRKIFRRKPVAAGYEPEMADLSYHPPMDAVRERVRGAKPAHDVAEIAAHVILRDYSLPEQEKDGRILLAFEDITDRAKDAGQTTESG